MLTYQRYLEAKKAVDDRTLNLQVASFLKRILPERNLKVVELGGGIGTMIVRCLEWGLVIEGEYTLIDKEPENIDHARRYLLDWSLKNDRTAINQGEDSMILSNGENDLKVRLICSDVTDHEGLSVLGKNDLLIAHLFLDLVDVRKNLERFLRLLGPGGVFYFTHIYDGQTTILPEMDDDVYILRRYDECMNEREDEHSPYPRSHTGREVLQLLLDMNDIEIVESGSSDWVVLPKKGGYAVDEEDFLRYIIEIIEGALDKMDSIESKDLTEWVRNRRMQIENGEMALIAHQLDVVGKYYG